MPVLTVLFERGNLLKTPEGKLAFIDFGNVCDIREEDRYGLFGLTIGLQNKDLSLVTENLLKVNEMALARLQNSVTLSHSCNSS
jgi:predicted unusual protein kinase regulating ubiquinone biosynthesis (AarF/ABC1/UbiB family)